MNKNISRDSINREDKNKHKEIVFTGMTRKKKNPRTNVIVREETGAD
jgi:hypothetical protein